ncbi:putative deacetoxyvindoline 4-hydroxylase-like [Capsicum annuum]|nr:putative deacetoxyvindoline 4-hydroxylase-like [Capsicum annuum]
MIDEFRKFHQQDVELKKEYYSRDRGMRRVRYESNIHLYQSHTANWRDTLNISMLITGHIEPEEIPAICRKEVIDYTNHVKKLGDTLLDLLSEALGLNTDRLKSMECAKGKTLILSNDKFVSVNHRVLAKKVGPRISVACFLHGDFEPLKIYGPIKELISEENPQLYKEFLVRDYMAKFFSRPVNMSGLDLFRM